MIVNARRYESRNGTVTGYDVMERVVYQRIDFEHGKPLETWFEHDADGNMVWHTFTDGRLKYSYVKDADGKVTRHEFNAEGEIVRTSNIAVRGGKRNAA